MAKIKKKLSASVKKAIKEAKLERQKKYEKSYIATHNYSVRENRMHSSEGRENESFSRPLSMR
ncbi:hypothetical protein CXF72_11590 [Psychromonas sp. MB-3u-54]|nr:hypothetical protein CXF72_11590 [Psychromonas sp. MB-3u-54]